MVSLALVELLFYTALGMYGVQMVCAWGEGARSFTTAIIVGMGLMVAPWLPLLAIPWPFENWIWFPLAIYFLSLPLILRRLSIWRLNRPDAPQTARRRRRPAGWGRIQEALARRNLVLAYQLGRMPWGLILIVSLAALLCASYNSGAMALSITTGVPFTLLLVNLGLFYAFGVTYTATRKAIRSGAVELWQQAGLTAASVVDGFALWASLAPCWILLLIQPFWLGAASGIGLGLIALCLSLWAAVVVMTAAYAGIYAARKGHQGSPAIVFPTVLVQLGMALPPQPYLVASYALQSLALLCFLWFFRRRSITVCQAGP